MHDIKHIIIIIVIISTKIITATTTIVEQLPLNNDDEPNDGQNSFLFIHFVQASKQTNKNENSKPLNQNQKPLIK